MFNDYSEKLSLCQKNNEMIISHQRAHLYMVLEAFGGRGQGGGEED